MNTTLTNLCAQLLSALGNGLWQGLVLTALACGGLKVLRGLNAASRYAVELATLVIVAALPVVHFLIAALAGNPTPPGARAESAARGSGCSLDLLATARVASENRSGTTPSLGASQPSFRIERNVGWVVEEPDAEAGSSDDRPLPANAPKLRTVSATPQPTEPAVDDILRPEVTIVPDRDETDVGSDRSRASGPPPVVESVAPSESRPVVLPPAPSAGLQAWRLSLSPGLSLALVSGWGAVAGARLVFLVWQYLALVRLKRRSPQALPPQAVLFDSLCRQMCAQRPVTLRFNDELNSPLAAGFRSPAVLLPTRLVDEPASTLEQVLRHELAHLARGDDWTNLIQQFIKATLFFHPSVVWLSRRLTVDREIACDDHVLAATLSPRDYALFLTEFASRARERHWAPAPAAWSNHSQLKERIRMLLDSKRNTSPQLVRAKVGTLSTAAALLAALGLYAGPRLAFAQAEAPPAPVEPASNSPDASPAREISADRTNSAQPVPPTPQPAPSAKPPEPVVKPVVSATKPATARIEAAGAALTATAPSVNVAPAAATPPVSISFTPAIAAQGAPPMAVLALPKPADAALPAATPIATSGLPAPEVPVAPKFQPPVRDRNEALEQRLDRVERMLELLLARQEKVSAAGEREPIRPSAAYGSHSEGLSAPRSEAEAGYGAEFNGRTQARYERQVQPTRERMDRDARKAADVVERARQEAELRVTADATQAQRRALEEQRQALQKRIADIEAQLNRLAQQLDRVNQQFEHLQEMKPQPEAQNQPAVPTQSFKEF